MPEIIYCDESGFSGNNLADDGTPYFVFASLKINPDTATDLVAQLKTDYKLQGELKGANLTKHNRGRKALGQLVKSCANFSKIAMADKKFALAGKLFEYVFEPAIADNNSLFYEIGFHKFIANLLYGELITKPETAGRLLVEFQEGMRALDFSRVAGLFASHNGKGANIAPSELVLRFAAGSKESVIAELDNLRDASATGKWVLDLSTTCLDGLLSFWGETMDGLHVVCDDSKPLKELQEPFNWRVGPSKGKKYVELGGRRKLVTYNLGQPIAFGNSRDHPGLQLADGLATALSHSMNNLGDEEARIWRKQLFEANAIHEDCIVPELEHADLRNPSAVLNAMVLTELLERLDKGEDLLAGMDMFVDWIYSELPNILGDLDRVSP
jgi:hypothetical protein